MRATVSSFDDIVESTDWSRLTDAYQVATDAPTHLRALAFSTDVDEQKQRVGSVSQHRTAI